MGDIAGKNVIWLDDEWESPYQFALGPWKRSVEQRTSQAGIKLHCCSSLVMFSEAVRRCSRASPDDRAPGISLLIVDVMLNFDSCPTFSDIGFPQENIIPLEAGAQVAGLIRSSQFDESRPHWLASVRETPLLVLSASPQAPGWVNREVGRSRMNGVEIVLKNLVRRSDGFAMEPEPEFTDAFGRLLSL
jgi:hypothetical protein